jgi:hypothetical protein
MMCCVQRRKDELQRRHEVFSWPRLITPIIWRGLDVRHHCSLNSLPPSRLTHPAQRAVAKRLCTLPHFSHTATGARRVRS